MSLYVLASAKGSPGVTTTALVLAHCWPRLAMLAELDVSGGDLAYRLRDEFGDPLHVDDGFLHRTMGAAGSPAELAAAVAEQVQSLINGMPVLAGSSPDSYLGLTSSGWSRLGEALASGTDTDVLADCGRLDLAGDQVAILAHAEAILFLTRPVADAVAHLRSSLQALDQPSVPPRYVAVVTGARDNVSAKRVQQVLTEAELDATVVGSVAFDPTSAGALAGEWHAKLSRGALTQSVETVMDQLMIKRRRRHAVAAGH